MAYADFVTAMMALFLVLWLVSQADVKIKQSIANYFRSPGIFDSALGGILPQTKKTTKEPNNFTSKDDELALFTVSKDLYKKFATRPEFSKAKDRVKIELTDEGLKIEITDKENQDLFPSGSAELPQESKQILKEIFAGLCELPNKIIIGGHTDSYNFATTSNYTNWELSMDRANAARRILESVCAKPKQIHRIFGYGNSQPLVPEDHYAPANRRISIMVLRLSKSDLADVPENTSIKTNDFEENQKPTIDKTLNNAIEKTGEKRNTDEVDLVSEEKKLLRAKLRNERTIRIEEPNRIPAQSKFH